MGTFWGHVLPGSFFFIFGVWWSFATAIRYIHTRTKSLYKKDHQFKYKATVTMPCICCPCYSLRRAPIESILKLFFTTVGIIGELATGIHYRPVSDYSPKPMLMEHGYEHVHARSSHTLNMSSLGTKMGSKSEAKQELWLIPSNAQHITMYTGFALGGLAFGIEAYLFYFHLHGKDVLEVHVHTLLVYSILGCMFCGLFEMIFNGQILLTYGRILFTILQGTWFIEIAFVLYPPFDGPQWKWDPNEMNHIMLITLSYAWHIFLIIFGLIFQMWIMKRIYLKSKKISEKFDELIEIDNCLLSNDEINVNDTQSTKFLRLLSDDESEGEKLIYDSIRMEEQNVNKSSF